MPLKVSKGDMYPWVTHTHVHLGGQCVHGCCYCYVDNPRFGRHEKYTGDIRLIEKEFLVNYGVGRVIFIDNMNDLFAKAVPTEWIGRVLGHCNQWPDNTYVFQTKNPERFLEWDPFPVANATFGTTIETNRWVPEVMGQSPRPEARAAAMQVLSAKAKTFITLEPIMDFDVDELADMVVGAKPAFVNIGADSKRKGLPEPTWGKIVDLVERLRAGGVEIRKKVNLDRLMII